MKEYMTLHIPALLLGILLDLLIGDPHFLPHPIRGIGRLIACLERRLRGPETASDGAVETASEDGDLGPNRLRRRGILLWFTLIFVVLAITMSVMVVSCLVNRWIGFTVEVILTFYILAAGSLRRESMAVAKNLSAKDLSGAKQALSMIVGRDTAPLGEEEIIQAAVETVAENTSDGVIAPLLYTAIGGPVLGMVYKAVNTMDSMLGYHNEKYEHFGRFAAKADDVFNFLPARISALCMIASAAALGVFSKTYSGRGAGRIWLRDRRNHTSPNSAQTESVCAGALGLKLGGAHLYQGVIVEKPTIGDAVREIETADIRRANVLMFVTEAVAVLLVTGLFSALYFLNRF